MKKRVLSVFLLSLVLPIIASSNKDSISEYTYISRSSYPSRKKVRFNADRTLDFFENGKWKHVDSVVPDKENLNFIVHKSDDPEFFQLFYGDDCETGLGVLSEDRRTLYMADVEDDFIFSREEAKANLKFATNYTYVSESGDSFDKVQFNADNSLDLFLNGEKINIVYVTWPNKKTLNFISRPNQEEDVNLIGFFSADEKTLYLGQEVLLMREGLTAEYTYISESHDDIFKVRFNTDKTLDFFENGKWKHVGSVVPDKENLNFIVHKSDNSEILSDLDESKILLGFLSEDKKSLYIGTGYIFLRAESGEKSKSVTRSYINSPGANASYRARFNSDNSCDCFVDGEWSNTLYVTWSDEKKQIFTSRPNPGDDVDIVGVFSADERTLYLGEVGFFFELCSPKLTFDSINVGGITLHSTPEDLLIQYPAARVIHKDNQTEFLVDGLDGFAEVRFTFKNDKLVHILKYEPELLGLDRDEKVSALVQKSVRELTEKYGKPKINQPAFGGGRIFNWYGEVVIELGYYFSSVDEYGHRMREYCSINYDFDSCDSGL